jgi:hypothetical protein
MLHLTSFIGPLHSFLLFTLKAVLYFLPLSFYWSSRTSRASRASRAYCFSRFSRFTSFSHLSFLISHLVDQKLTIQRINSISKRLAPSSLYTIFPTTLSRLSLSLPLLFFIFFYFCNLSHVCAAFRSWSHC